MNEWITSSLESWASASGWRPNPSATSPLIPPLHLITTGSLSGFEEGGGWASFAGWNGAWQSRPVWMSPEHGGQVLCQACAWVKAPKVYLFFIKLWWGNHVIMSSFFRRFLVSHVCNLPFPFWRVCRILYDSSCCLPCVVAQIFVGPWQVCSGSKILTIDLARSYYFFGTPCVAVDQICDAKATCESGVVWLYCMQSAVIRKSIIQRLAIFLCYICSYMYKFIIGYGSSCNLV